VVVVNGESDLARRARTDRANSSLLTKESFIVFLTDAV
jgi:hypothetical protein